MQGDPKVIEYLNKGLRSELTAINQYWLHYRLLNNWGLLEMAKVWRKESIEEMEHADKFTDRILFLDGFPNMQVLDPLRIGQNVKEIIECDLASEIAARTLYQEPATHCHTARHHRAFDPLTRPQFRAHQRLAAMEIDFPDIDAQHRARRLAELHHRGHQLRLRRHLARAADAQRLVDPGHEEDQLHEATSLDDVAKAVDAVVARAIRHQQQV